MTEYIYTEYSGRGIWQDLFSPYTGEDKKMYDKYFLKQDDEDVVSKFAKLILGYVKNG